MFGYELKLENYPAQLASGLPTEPWLLKGDYEGGHQIVFDIEHISNDGLALASNITLFNVPPEVLLNPSALTGWKVTFKAGLLKSNLSMLYYGDSELLKTKVEDLPIILTGFIWQALPNVNLRTNSIMFNIWQMPPPIEGVIAPVTYKFNPKKGIHITDEVAKAVPHLSRDAIQFDLLNCSRAAQDYIVKNKTIGSPPTLGNIDDLKNLLVRTYGLILVIKEDNSSVLITQTDREKGFDVNANYSRETGVTSVNGAKEILINEYVGQPALLDIVTLKIKLDLTGKYKLLDTIIIDKEAANFVDLSPIRKDAIPTSISTGAVITEKNMTSVAKSYENSFTPLYVMGKYLVLELTYEGNFREGEWTVTMECVKLE